MRLSPARTRIQVEIHNRSGTVRPVGSFSLAGDDWDALRFVDDTLPRTILAHDSVELELELSPASFRSQPGVYRSGHASLSFSSDQFDYEVPIEFLGSEVDRSGTGAALLAALALTGLALALAFAWVPRRRAGPSPKTDPSAGSTSPGLRVAVAGACSALLLVAATIPVGLGLCRGRLGALVGPRELEQCREGLGGAQLLALPGSLGIWWWLVSLALVTATMTVVRTRLVNYQAEHGPASALALAGLRLLGFALLLVALVCGLSPASADATALILAQTGFVKLAGLDVPRWGIVAQPLGFALGFALVVLAVPRERPEAAQDLAALERFELLVWATLLVTSFLGGPAIPGVSQRPVPLLAHGPQLAIELFALVLEVALVVILAERLRAHVSSLGVTDERLLEVQARWLIPLALLNLVGVLIWHAM